MMLSILRLKVTQSKKNEIVDILEYLKMQTSIKTGCNRIDIYCTIENEESLIYVEEWDSQTDLWKHICSKEYKKLLTAMDLAEEMPELKFYSISSSQSFELVKELRKQRHQSII